LQWMVREREHDQQTRSGVVVIQSKVSALREAINKRLQEQPGIIDKLVDRITNHITSEETTIQAD
jgi:hypothetical protein